MEVMWEEIELNTAWGTLRGKKCGSGKRKMLGIHGWLDNANTFDCITPLLHTDFTFVCLDLPGHGKSDHFNNGFIYDPRGYAGAIKKAVVVLQWTKFTYIGHSMGAVVGILYTSIFPEDVDSFVSIDIIKPWSLEEDKYPTMLRKYFNSYFDNEQKYVLPPIVYNKEELIKKTIAGSGNSLDVASASLLLERGSCPSEDGNGYCLTRDLRAKTYFIGFTSQKAWNGIASSIKCPVLIIKARSGKHYDTPEVNTAMLESFARDCPVYRYHELEGHHHVHMTHAADVALVLQAFLDETRPYQVPCDSIIAPGTTINTNATTINAHATTINAPVINGALVHNSSDVSNSHTSAKTMSSTVRSNEQKDHFYD